MGIKKVNIAEKFNQFEDAWNPRIIGSLNGQEVKIARFKGAFTTHTHEEEDELFLVIEGKVGIRFKNKTAFLEAGEMIIVPKGTEHQPFAEGEAKVLMFEPSSTLNTGNQKNEFTKETLDYL